jgi:hypothetical protein
MNESAGHQMGFNFRPLFRRRISVELEFRTVVQIRIINNPAKFGFNLKLLARVVLA